MRETPALTTQTYIYELPQHQFSRAAHLYADVPFDQPCYETVFTGRQPGRIFADDPDAPRAALMCRTYEYYPAGALDTPLRAFIREAPEEADVFQRFYGYAPTSKAWADALRADTPALEDIPRRQFVWQPGTPIFDWRAHLTEDMRIVPIDRALAERVDREVTGGFPLMAMVWSDLSEDFAPGGYARYERDGFGYALFVGETLASVCYAISVSSQHALISIDTQPEFRLRKLATAVSARFVEHCLQSGLLPLWDCDALNPASALTALRVGLVETTPFVELAFPQRAKPAMSRGVWSCVERDDGLNVWTRDR
jgi:hypothetical protein